MTLRTLSTILVTTLLAAPAARGDTFWVGSAGGSALEYSNVTITGISEGKLLFQTNGRETTRDLATVARIQLDDDPGFSTAEKAYADRKFEPATDQYLSSLQTTGRTWLRPRIAQRLMDSAQRVNRFDAAATGYIAAVSTSATPATIAKPAIPQGRSAFIPAAIKQVNAAIATGKLAPAQKSTLAAFLVELQRGGGDTAAAAATAEQTLKSDAAGGDTAAAFAVAKSKLDAATTALQKKDFAGAAAQINQNRAVFVDPRDQAAALLILADAQAGASAMHSDTNAWKDVAVAYMRVVANFPDSAQAPKALLSAADIEQHQLSDAQAAKSLYQEIVTRFPNDLAAATARQQLQTPAK